MKKKKEARGVLGSDHFLSLSLSFLCASGGTPEGRRTASPLACRSLTQRVLVLERGLVSLHHGCCAFVHKDVFSVFLLLPRARAPKGRYKWALQPTTVRASGRAARLSRGRGGQAHEGPLGVVVGVASALGSALETRAQNSPKRSSVSDLVMIETVPRDLTPRLKKGRIFFFTGTCTFPLLRLP